MLHAQSRTASSKQGRVPRFKAGDTVEFLLHGEWTKGQILAVGRKQYNVKLPDGATQWADASHVRKIAPPTPAGQSPKPGLTSCSGKVEGKYSSASGYPNIEIRPGTASVQGAEPVECWMGGGKIYFHTPGTRPDQDFVMEIHSDGSLDTPLGEIRKKAGK
jgi:hypothetical protein